MLLSSLDALLLYILTIPIVMKYRILPIDGTPYWLFGLLFFILTVHVGISMYPEILGLWKKRLELIKNICFMLVFVIVLGGVTISSMADRAKTAPVYNVHDIILQQEAAMRFLIVGKNPYKESYFGTPVESFNYDEPGNTEAINPALYHFVMPPWYLLFPFSFYYTARPLVGYFDGRFASLFCMVGLLGVIWMWFKDKRFARIAIALTAFSPAVFDYFLEGRSDIFAYFWLIASLYLLEHKKHIWSAVFLGLACMSKQTIWFVLPFYATYVWIIEHKSVRKMMTMGSTVLVVIGALSLPFIVWDYKAFFDSVIFYLSGNAPHSYPVSGYGLSMILHEFGWITDIHAYYPFAYWQLFFGFPLLIWLVYWLARSPHMSKLLIAYGMLLTIVWYCSRYFNNSHLGYISMIFVLGLLKDADERAHI